MSVFDPEQFIEDDTEVVEGSEYDGVIYAEVTTELVTIEYERERSAGFGYSGRRRRLKTKEPVSGQRTIILDEHAENEAGRVESVLSDLGWDYVEVGE